MTWYVVDGMDGCGKTTCAEFLKEKLESEGRRVFMVSHPDRSCLAGRLEYGYLHKEGKLAKILSTLFFILDAVNSIFRMRIGSRKYDDFIFVRYLMSVAYLPDGIYRKAYGPITKLFPMPDEFILVDVDAETSLRRIMERGEELESFENIEDLSHIREKMLSLSEGWHVIDNTRGFEEVRSSVSDIADSALSKGRCFQAHPAAAQTPAPKAAPMSAVRQLLAYFEMYPRSSRTAPSTLSMMFPKTPAAKGIMSIQSRLWAIMSHPRTAIARDAAVDTDVPRRDTPPLVPGGTLLKLVMR